MITPKWTTCIALSFLAACFSVNALAQAPAREIPLYRGVAPGSENWHYEERTAGTRDKPQAQNIVRPVLLYYPAEKATAVGTAVIVAPKGLSGNNCAILAAECAALPILRARGPQ